MSVMTSVWRLSSFHAASSSGRFSTIIHAPTLTDGTTCASAVARPETPPGAISFGTLKTAMDAAISAQPITTQTASPKGPSKWRFAFLLLILSSLPAPHGKRHSVFRDD